MREPPIGLLILTAILKEHEYSVDLLDCSIEENPEEALSSIASKYRIIGFTSLTNTFGKARQLMDIARTVNPNCIILYGGPHATFRHEECLKNVRPIDFVCIGEYENSILGLVNALLKEPIYYLLDKISEFPLIYRPNTSDLPLGTACRVDQNGKIVFSQEFTKIKQITSITIFQTSQPDPVDMNLIPLPSREILEYPYYVADILVNRGCPNQCSFCSRQKLFGNIPRLRTIENVSKEIDDIISFGNYKFVNFYDNINMSPKWFRQFLKMLIDKKFRIPWGCELRADLITIDDAKLMKRAGCQIAATGVESADETVLKTNFKYQDPQTVKRGIEALKTAGIKVQSYFVLGLPGENEVSFNKTLEYLQTLPIDQGDEVNIFIATPYPGSEIGENSAKYEATIIEQDYEKYDCETVIMEYPHLTAEKIHELKQKAENIVKRLKGL